jgi:hypothetical protein
MVQKQDKTFQTLLHSGKFFVHRRFAQTNYSGLSSPRICAEELNYTTYTGQRISVFYSKYLVPQYELRPVQSNPLPVDLSKMTLLAVPCCSFTTFRIDAFICSLSSNQCRRVLSVPSCAEVADEGSANGSMQRSSTITNTKGTLLTT